MEIEWPHRWQMYLRFGLFFSLVWFGPALGQINDLNLEEALRLGFQKNFDLRLEKIQVNVAKTNTALGTGEFLPKVDATGSVGYGGTLTDSFESGTSSEYASAGLEMNWTLFDGFKMFANKKIYSKKEELAGFKFKSKVEDVAVSITRAYYELATQAILLSAAEEQLKISEERLKKTKLRRELGAASELEFLQARVALNADASALESRRLGEKISRDNLLLAMGITQRDSFAVRGEVPEIDGDYNYDDLMATATEKNTGLSMERKLLEVSKLEESIGRSHYWPKVIATGSYTWTGDSDSGPARMVGGDNQSYSVGLSARLPLFAGFKNKVAHRVSSLKKESAEVTVEQYNALLGSLLYQQLAIYQNAKEQIGFEKDAVLLAEKNLTLSEAGLSLGNVTGVEFRDAQQNLTEARVRLATAQFQAHLARVELNRLTGNLKLSQ